MIFSGPLSSIMRGLRFRVLVVARVFSNGVKRQNFSYTARLFRSLWPDLENVMRKVFAVLLILVIFVVAGLYVVTRPQMVSSEPPPPIAQDVLDQLPSDRAGQVLIYGAYGFTGAGIARLAKDYAITPVLAGRNESKLRPLADDLGYD